MQWDGRVGRIKKGLYGDLVAVKGDPRSDISELENIDIVIKGGLLFKAPSTHAFPWTVTNKLG